MSRHSRGATSRACARRVLAEDGERHSDAWDHQSHRRSADRRHIRFSVGKHMRVSSPYRSNSWLSELRQPLAACDFPGTTRWWTGSSTNMSAGRSASAIQISTDGSRMTCTALGRPGTQHVLVPSICVLLKKRATLLRRAQLPRQDTNGRTVRDGPCASRRVEQGPTEGGGRRPKSCGQPARVVQLAELPANVRAGA